MSYEPTEWKKGDVVTSQKLNKLEQGVAGAGGMLVVHMDETGALDKKAGEIKTVINNGYIVNILNTVDVLAPIIYQIYGWAVMADGDHAGEIAFFAYDFGMPGIFNLYAATDNDYPVATDSPGDLSPVPGGIS